MGTDELLDALCTCDYDTQSDIASKFNVSTKTIGRRISKLKEDGLLIVHRYQDNNFIFMIGSDAENNWNKHDAYETARYRKCIQDVPRDDIDSLSDDDMKSLLDEYPLFKNELQDAYIDNGYYSKDAGKNFNVDTSSISQSLELTIEDKEWLDINIGITI